LSLTIRRGDEADLAACAALYERVVQETFTWFAAEELTDAPFWDAAEVEELYVAERNGVLVGLASVYRPDRFLHSLYVEHNVRGQGVGSALFDHVRQVVGGPISLKVQKLNTGAIDFYRRRGLQVVDTGDEDQRGGGWFLMAEPGES
jgi:ribosomal protein S18 acetylase RimI-like enzyme